MAELRAKMEQIMSQLEGTIEEMRRALGDEDEDEPDLTVINGNGNGHPRES